ncbi:polyprenyl synthetase family protein [Ferrovum myxofaciens]|uniref:Octaprenyl diphosphate synthase n=1 Tax=Ferrovum myxofaciens TaxID=416213 RepID=A0A8F3IJ25_9PROT|nr:polyprenyl synthetase family protein [Ferrovum myxofaciens]NDU90256.1 octaprenyl diphosphate synthase [Ferrovum sp.]KXW58134.1 octaprenyl-diphosphate synthase [Ferrovum myxofaciens]MBU6994492.1 polyprenyl synthetase family protein [Ferrovum myxofaciens]QKE38364.1 MAG: polyprenyl synthetase family protein [Ferrovum myxofaciens]QWY76101.1 MAG: polyprenyl synthetase family protein [Ferrovum myxofaciens]
MSFEPIRILAADDLKALDAVIRHHLHSDVALVRQIAEYLIHSGGKRLRPLLLLLCARALGYQGHHHHTLAAVVEFIHTATLLHDDVVDKSDLRRGQKTANSLFGNEASVLVGDFIYSRAFQMMVSVNQMKVMEVLADATNVIAEGEVLQLLNCHDPEVDESRYLQVIRYKTAKLFESATRLAGILSEAPLPIEEHLATFGGELGTAFQIIDDVLDYSGQLEDLGKNLGDDLAEGKATLPVIRALQTAAPAQADLLRNAIEQGGGSSLEAVACIVRDSGALEYARQRALQFSQSALAHLNQALPPSTYRDALQQLTLLAVERTQ